MKILLIDDDLFFQKFYSLKLKEQGIEVDIASDGEEGFAKAGQFAPDLILLDLIMPKVDGFSFLQKRLADENIKKIPVIVFSTLGQEKDIENAKQLGAIDYIDKTFFDFNAMMEKINKYNILKSRLTR